MIVNTLKSYFKYTSGQRSGILAILFIIIILQLAYFFVDFTVPENPNPEKQKWLALQEQIDSLKQDDKKKKLNYILSIQIL